jgi:hypothetical protein
MKKKARRSKVSPFFNYVAMLAVAALVYCVCSVEHRPAPIQEVIEETVIVDTAEGNGTGLMVSVLEPDGHHTTYVWTASHVVRDQTKLAIIDCHGRRSEASIVDISDAPDDKDIALLRVWDQDFSTRSTRFHCDAPPAMGAEIFHIGHFLGLQFPYSYSIGYFVAPNREGFDQIGLTVYPGSSGGGIFLTNGECIGICARRVGDGGLDLIIPVRTMRAWAAEHGHADLLP